MLAERRERPRHSISSGCLFETSGGDCHGGTLMQVSASGAFIAAPARLSLGSLVIITHETGGRISAIVVRQSENGFGVAFELGEPSVTFALRVVAGSMAEMAVH
jgi:hypothetical protein